MQGTNDKGRIVLLWTHYAKTLMLGKLERKRMTRSKVTVAMSAPLGELKEQGWIIMEKI